MKQERESEYLHAEHFGQLTPHFFPSLCQGVDPQRIHHQPIVYNRFLRTGGFELTSKVPTAKAVIVQWGTWRNKKKVDQESSHP